MEYLFSVLWKNVVVGRCFYKGKYIFIYDLNGVKECTKFGFDKLIGFPNLDEIYINDNLFPIFESRIISPKRKKLISKEDKINFLINTNGKLITDNITIEKEEIENVKKRI